MKNTYFHGTSFDYLKSIMAKGFNPYAAHKVWKVSSSGVYLWDAGAFAQMEEYAGDDGMAMARQMAYESAQLTYTLSKSGKCVVFEIELDEDRVTPDFSCRNMDGAVVCRDKISPKCIKRVWISPDLGLLKGYYIAMAIRNPLFAGTFSKVEKQVANAFRESEFMIESDEFPLEILWNAA